jgi:DNA-binding PadR family transcriptional regulator
VLELAILGLLKEQQLHGYELKKRLADTVGSGSGSGASFGSIYPALGRLEKAGAVTVVPVPGVAGRGKKVYAITGQGERLFDELLVADASTSEDERIFNLRLAFARHLSCEARIGMLERRRAFLLERLAKTRAAVRHGWGRFDAYSRSLMEHGNETTERDISWLEKLIARERETIDAPGVSGAALSSVVPSSFSGGPAEVAVADTGPGSPPATSAAWAALAPPTMPVRPKSAPLAASQSHTPSHQRGGTIQ